MKIKKVYLGQRQIYPETLLPGGYQEVEYIQCSGTQYILTNKNVEDGHIYKAKFRFVSGTLYWRCFGGHYSSSENGRLFAGSCESGGAKRGIGYGSSIDYNYGSPSTGVDYEAEVKLANGSQYLKLDGTTKFTKSFSFSSSSTHKIAVFGTSQPNGSIGGLRGATRMYYRKLYDTKNNLELDLVPCYRREDGVIGMYDLVEGVFYTNSGTGTFTKGPDVN